MRRHVALTGFMAAGKSVIGRKLARKLGSAFFDVDDLIVSAHGPIADIFYSRGEAQFREYEYETVASVLNTTAGGIIALGGGAVTYDKTLALLEKRTYRVFIKVAPEQIAGRLRRSKRIRPLVGPAPSLSKIKELYAQRMPRYAHADLVVEADTLPPNEIVERIAGWMRHKNIGL